MSINRITLYAIPLCLLACAKKPKQEARVEPTPPAPMVQSQPETPSDAKTAVRIQDLLAEALKPIYFPYDQAMLPQASKDILSKAGDLLKGAPSVTVLIEGNADERGTEVYNLALGEKRAAVVRNYLVQYGVPASRLKLISYGEEKPAIDGHDEGAWSQNRRDEFKVTLEDETP